MAHHLYHTQAIVIGHADRGDANRAFYLLTRELGLVVATAQSIRHLKSKLRYHLQLGRIPSVTLVRGRETWRIVGAEAGEDVSRLWRFSAGRRFIRSSFALIRKLIHGEEHNPAVFELFTEAFRYVSADPAARADSEAELIITLRLLHHLGYLQADQRVLPLIKNNEWESEVLAQAKNRREDLELLAKETLLSTHL
ncbi:MAG TPA: recombination protein O N-terminal domain-containing protein [Candidatus Paceibacterota bacterium]|nr:recombination protein O N-terminal domain-containing protein [Candidatus Paceibacterota bacterium]